MQFEVLRSTSSNYVDWKMPGCETDSTKPCHHTSSRIAPPPRVCVVHHGLHEGDSQGGPERHAAAQGPERDCALHWYAAPERGAACLARISSSHMAPSSSPCGAACVLTLAVCRLRQEQRPEGEVLVHQGPRPEAVHLQRGRGQRHQGLGRGRHWHGAGRGESPSA